MLTASFESPSHEVGHRTANTRADHSHLLAIVAHELRNPLAPIRNAAAILNRDALEPSVRRSAARIIDRQLDGMLRLINDLSDLSRLQRGSFILMRAPVTLAAIIDLCLENVAPFVAEHRQQLIVRVAKEPVSLWADPMRICQAVQNLVSNAAKYTDQGGEIRLDAHREGNEAVITVRDNGIGIDAEQLKIIFDMYAQAGQSGAQRAEGGLGIGLYLARYLVEAHHGSIVAASAGKGLGSEFTLRLPCAAPAAMDEELRKADAARAADRSPS